MTGILVTMRHVREAKLCARGAREWAQAHDFSWDKFLESGLPVETMEATGDAYALRLARIARMEAESGRQ